MVLSDLMGIRVELSNEQEQALRENAMRKFGYQKGALKKAISEAIDMWLSQEKGKEVRVTNPTKKLVGILAGINETSVELQHQATKLFLTR